MELEVSAPSALSTTNVPVLSQISSVHTSTYFLMISSNIINLYKSTSSINLQVFPPKLRMHFPPIYATRPAHLTFLHLITRIVFWDQWWRFRSSSLCSHFPATCYAVPLVPMYLQQTILRHPQPIDWLHQTNV